MDEIVIIMKLCFVLKMMNNEFTVIFVITFAQNSFIKNHLKSQTHTKKVCKEKQLNNRVLTILNK